MENPQIEGNPMVYIRPLFVGSKNVYLNKTKFETKLLTLLKTNDNLTDFYNLLIESKLFTDWQQLKVFESDKFLGSHAMLCLLLNYSPNVSIFSRSEWSNYSLPYPKTANRLALLFDAIFSTNKEELDVLPSTPLQTTGMIYSGVQNKIGLSPAFIIPYRNDGDGINLSNLQNLSDTKKIPWLLNRRIQKRKTYISLDTINEQAQREAYFKDDCLSFTCLLNFESCWFTQSFVTESEHIHTKLGLDKNEQIAQLMKNSKLEDLNQTKHKKTFTYYPADIYCMNNPIYILCLSCLGSPIIFKKLFVRPAIYFIPEDTFNHLQPLKHPKSSNSEEVCSFCNTKPFHINQERCFCWLMLRSFLEIKNGTVCSINQNFVSAHYKHAWSFFQKNKTSNDINNIQNVLWSKNGMCPLLRINNTKTNIGILGDCRLKLANDREGTGLMTNQDKIAYETFLKNNTNVPENTKEFRTSKNITDVIRNLLKKKISALPKHFASNDNKDPMQLYEENKKWKVYLDKPLKNHERELYTNNIGSTPLLSNNVHRLSILSTLNRLILSDSTQDKPYKIDTFNYIPGKNAVITIEGTKQSTNTNDSNFLKEYQTHNSIGSEQNTFKSQKQFYTNAVRALYHYIIHENDTSSSFTINKKYKEILENSSAQKHFLKAFKDFTEGVLCSSNILELTLIQEILHNISHNLQQAYDFIWHHFNFTTHNDFDDNVENLILTKKISQKKY